VATYYSATNQVVIISYVDDCLLIGPFISKINALKKKLARAYNIEDLGAAHYFLGVKIVRNRGKR